MSTLTPEQKLDEALKGTFPASDPFYLPPASGGLAVEPGADKDRVIGGGKDREGRRPKDR